MIVDVPAEASKKLRQLKYEVPKSWGQTLRRQHTFQALQGHIYNGS